MPHTETQGDEIDAGGRPSRVLALLLGLALPGLGHLYAGRIARGGIVFALGVAVALPLQFASAFLATTPLAAALVRLGPTALRLLCAADGVLAVGRLPRHRWSVLHRVLLTGACAALGAGAMLAEFELIRTRFVSIARVPTGAMKPTIEVGDLVLVDRRSGALQHLALGDAIAFRYPDDPDTEYLKRIAGLPGETVEVKQGCLFVDGSSRCRDLGDGDAEHVDGKVYRIRKGPGASRDFGPVVVPDGCLFVLGDNRSESADSRIRGFVPVELVAGRMRHVLWSVPVGAGSTWTKVRWERIGKTAFAE